MPIPVYIPSKNRSCQCDALIRSLRKNAPGLFDIHVVYTCTNKSFVEGYDKLIERFPEVHFEYEYDSTEQFYRFLRRLDAEIVGLFADDCICYRPTYVTEDNIRKFFDHQNTWSFSLRMGQNITVRDYISGELNKLPEEHTVLNEKFLIWNYKKGFPDLWSSSWSFALGFDGCFYRSKDLLFLANDEDFRGISRWESFICHNGRFGLIDQYWMGSPLQSNVFAQQINHTHDRSLTNNGYRRSLEELNHLYLMGWEISLASIESQADNIFSTHHEIHFEMVRI